MSIPVSSVKLNQANLTRIGQPTQGLGRDIHGKPIQFPGSTINTHQQKNVGWNTSTNRGIGPTVIKTGSGLEQISQTGRVTGLTQRNILGGEQRVIGSPLGNVAHVNSLGNIYQTTTTAVGRPSAIVHQGLSRSPVPVTRRSAIVNNRRISPIQGQKISTLTSNIPVTPNSGQIYVQGRFPSLERTGAVYRTQQHSPVNVSHLGLRNVQVPIVENFPASSGPLTQFYKEPTYTETVQVGEVQVNQTEVVGNPYATEIV